MGHAKQKFLAKRAIAKFDRGLGEKSLTPAESHALNSGRGQLLLAKRANEKARRLEEQENGL